MCRKNKQTVGGNIDFVRQLGDVDDEALLDLIEYLDVGFVRHERDGETFGAETTGTRHTMQIGVRVLGHVVVEHDVHSLNVHATTEQVCGDQNALLEVLELLVTRQPFLLGHCAVDGNGREVLLDQQLSQCHAALH